MTDPNSNSQNEYYRQQESRAEEAREQARSLRGDDPEEPTEVDEPSQFAEEQPAEPPEITETDRGNNH